MSNPAHTIFIYAALPCEARPLIEHFGLKKDLTSQPFEIYGHGEICLTVTGIGKCAMAAAVAYTQARASDVDEPIQLNVGIAGHADHELGSVFLAGKIIDADTGRNHYPPLVFSPPCAVETLRTHSRPQLGYADPHLYDMEGSAFYETAIRFSTGELVQCLKVVSDNRLAPADNLRPKQVSSLIAGQLPVIETVLTRLRDVKGSISSPEPCQLQALLGRFHFTASERHQLRNQLLRWECLSKGQMLEFDNINFRQGKDFLRWLAQQIDSADYVL